MDIQGSVHFREGEGFPIPFEGRPNIRRGLLPMPFLESRIVGTAFKEIADSTIKVTKGLLERNRCHVIQPGMLILLFQEGELCAERAW